jgi:hypothetical protein
MKKGGNIPHTRLREYFVKKIKNIKGVYFE